MNRASCVGHQLRHDRTYLIHADVGRAEHREAAKISAGQCHQAIVRRVQFLQGRQPHLNNNQRAVSAQSRNKERKERKLRDKGGRKTRSMLRAHLRCVLESGELIVRDIEHAQAVETAQVARPDRRAQRVVAQIEPLQLLHPQEQGAVQAAQLVVLETQILNVAARDLLALLFHQILRTFANRFQPIRSPRSARSSSTSTTPTFRVERQR